MTVAVDARSEGTTVAPGPKATVVARKALLLAQLAGLLVVAYAFEIETRTFFHVLLLALGGFLVHASLPDRFRLSFFAALSAVAIAVAIGLDAAAVVLVTGTLMIVTCHLPLPFRVRVALLVGLAVLLAFSRTGAWGFALPSVAWPVLASMFMFRLVLYLMALRRDPGASPPR